MTREPPSVKTVPRMSWDTPSLRVSRYWNRHPERAFALMMAMIRANETPAISDWPRVRPQSYFTWHGPEGKPAMIKKPDKILFRHPPQPYLRHDPYKMIGCPMCGGERYSLGWHRDWDGKGPSARGYWHVACSAAFNMMRSPFDFRQFFYDRQNGKCSLSGDDLGNVNDIQIDHFVPLYQVYRDYSDYSVKDLLVFWGPENLRAVTKKAHKAKSKHEAAERSGKFNG